MRISKKVGILALQGDVSEHIEATRNAAKKLQLNPEIISVRSYEDIRSIDALIIPGGESTALFKLCSREKIWKEIKNIKYIFGTCAGAILLAKNVFHKTEDQFTLEVMDLNIDRNAYGRQTESFEKEVHTSLGNLKAIFIRAPRILKIGKKVKIIAENEGEIIACEETVKDKYYLAACFHPELTTTIFHEYFLMKIFS